MFNLLMAGNIEAFQGDPWILERNRVFEHTINSIRNLYEELTPKQLSDIYDMPALMAYERSVDKNARLGRIDRVKVRPDSVCIHYSFIPELPEVTPDQFAGLAWELNIGNFEYFRTHWALKDVDLASELLDAGLITKDQVHSLSERDRALFSEASAAPESNIQPTVFRIPDGSVEQDLVSMMLPFDSSFDPVFDIVRSAGKEISLRVLNVKQIWDETEIIQDIFSLIYRSKFVVCDFSGRNPNVFYEAGIAHTLGRFVIPIVQNVDDIPFDLKHHRHIIYLNNDEGRQKLFQEILPRMKVLANRDT